jgi:hypothetical protein
VASGVGRGEVGLDECMCRRRRAVDVWVMPSNIPIWPGWVKQVSVQSVALQIIVRDFLSWPKALT